MTMKKNNEEIKERLLKARALSDDELTQVMGGAIYFGALGKYTIRCSTPGCYINQNIQPTVWDPDNPICPLCTGGILSYDFEPYEE